MTHSSPFCLPSTVYPDTTGHLERQVSSLPRRHFVAAPAFGPPPMARGAGLLFAVAGPYASKQAISHFLTPLMGNKIMDFGSNPEKAVTFKLIGNSMVLGLIELLSETMTLADKTEIGADRFYELCKVSRKHCVPSRPLAHFFVALCSARHSSLRRPSSGTEARLSPTISMEKTASLSLAV